MKISSVYTFGSELSSRALESSETLKAPSCSCRTRLDLARDLILHIHPHGFNYILVPALLINVLQQVWWNFLFTEEFTSD